MNDDFKVEEYTPEKSEASKLFDLCDKAITSYFSCKNDIEELYKKTGHDRFIRIYLLNQILTSLAMLIKLDEKDGNKNE